MRLVWSGAAVSSCARRVGKFDAAALETIKSIGHALDAGEVKQQRREFTGIFEVGWAAPRVAGQRSGKPRLTEGALGGVNVSVTISEVGRVAPRNTQPRQSVRLPVPSRFAVNVEAASVGGLGVLIRTVPDLPCNGEANRGGGSLDPHEARSREAAGQGESLSVIGRAATPSGTCPAPGKSLTRRR
jgi:hypothetical protein